MVLSDEAPTTCGALVLIETTNTSIMQRIALRYGLFAGLIVTSLMLLSIGLAGDSPNYDLMMVVGYASMILAFTMVYFGVRAYRDSIGTAGLSFRRALGLGLAIVVVASAMYVLGWMIYANTVATDFVDRMAEHQAAEIRASGRPAAEIQADLTRMEAQLTAYRRPLVMAGITFLEIFPVGLVVSFICALILRRPKESWQTTPAA